MEPNGKKCLNCGKDLVNAQRNFCSDYCRGAYHNNKDVEKICPNCGKTFIGKKSVKYCSQKCINESIKERYGTEGTCLCCGKPIKGINGKKFCGSKCKDKYKYHPVEKTCTFCGKIFMGSSFTKYCSDECKSKGWIKAFTKTNVEKFGVEYPLQSKEVREKGIETNLRKYGVRNVAQDGNIKAKIQETNLERYGTVNPLQNEEIHKIAFEKAVATNMERYGVPYYCMTEDCGNAGSTISKVNLEFEKFLNGLGFKTEKEFTIGIKSYDIKVGEVLIEINPYPYHNTTGSPRREPVKPSYHYNKLKTARDNGYRCVMVRDWDDKNKIPYLLDDNKEVIYARKCEVKQIEYNDCHQFFEDYHLQGDTLKNKDNVYIGLYYDDELVECMSFGKPRYNKKYEWEILRLCSHKDYRVVGGADRIFKHFLSLINTNSVISYCDMSKFDGKVYEQLGFKLLKWNAPSKHWYNPKTTQHVTDNLLRQRGFDQLFGTSYGKGTSNNELMKQAGFVEIYDCGQATFIRNK